MLDGLTSDELRVELAADGYWGYDNSWTADVFARISAPLFTRWANLSVWMPIYEWYSQEDGTGSGAGDVYISTDVQILHNAWFKTNNAKYIPQMTIRLGMKTASGEQFSRRRHYDSPGYFFDLAMGQSIPIKDLDLRLAGSIGFLCWQTSDARQNDAVMYGLLAKLSHHYFSVQAEWGGYVGWERYGDAPMVIKLRAAGKIKGFCIQPTFILAPNLKYKADFIIFNNDGTTEIIDVKGMKTKEYIVKKKIFEDKYNLKIKEI